MKIIYSLPLFFFLVSCATKYGSSHKNFNKFNQDLKYCLIKTCDSLTSNSLNIRLSLISPLLAYGGGGGGGGGSNLKNKKFSFYKFNLCMKKIGYTKKDDGIFKLPPLSCKN